MKICTFLALTALIFAGGAPAQVPQMINYQGRVAVGGVNYDGTGQFKFALVDGGTNAAATAHATASVDGTGHVKNVSVLIGGAGYTTSPTVTITDPGGLGSGATATAVVSAAGVITAINVTNGGSNYGPPGPAVTIADPPPNYVYNTFWSNDGSVFSGSPNTEPSLAVPLTVTKGLYSVLLGDTSLAHMTAVPASVFTNPDVRLRVWFNDGFHGSQLLTPDERLAAVGYAMVAAGVPDGAITASKIATGAVGSAQLAANAVTATNISAGAVGTAQLAANAVQGANIAAGTVGSAQLAPSLTIGGSLTVGGDLGLPVTTSPSTGVLTLGGSSFLHAYGHFGLGDGNTFVGNLAGNFSMTGYGNTGTGASTLALNTTGWGNTAAGSQALNSNTTGLENTAVGAFALSLNTTGSDNTAAGTYALHANTTGSNNTASGLFALVSNTTGIENTAGGAFALAANVTGNDNTASGYQALYNTTTGSDNTATGSGALAANTIGVNNTAAGYQALYSNTTGDDNTASGSGALGANSTGSDNVALGVGVLMANTTGSANTAVGCQALASNMTGGFNAAYGDGSLKSNTLGRENTAIGAVALFRCTGEDNIALGIGAGALVTSGDYNIDIGNEGSANDSYTMRIGESQDSTYIAGIRGETVSQNDGVPVLIDSSGKLGTVNSSRRYKEDITEMGAASERLYALRPVTFRYKKAYADGSKPVQFGLIAEEVAEAFPELAVFNDQGQPETVKYQDLAPLLLNEVLKNHCRLQDAETARAAEMRRKDIEIDDLKKRLAELETRNQEREARLTRLEQFILSAPDGGATTAATGKGK